MDSKVLSDCVSWHALLVSSSCGEHVLCIGDIHFAWSHLLASFGHDQNFEQTPRDKDFHWINCTCALVWG